MIGLLLRSMGGDVGVVGCMGLIVACCVAAGLYKCSECRIRDCACYKWWLLKSGQDACGDFDLFIIVHEIFLTTAYPNDSRIVRLAAGDQTVSTDPHTRVFQQPVSMLVEQGTDTLEVSIFDARGRTKEARLEIDIADILKAEGGYTEHIFSMKATRHGIANPRVKLTIRNADDNNLDEEEGIFAKMDIPDGDTGMMVMEHLQKVQKAEHPSFNKGSGSVERTSSDVAPAISEEVALLASANAGYLDKLGSWGSMVRKYVAVHTKPKSKILIGIWEDKHGYEQEKEPEETIDIMRVRSVQCHPTMTTAFMINVVLPCKQTKQYTFFDTDRSRDVWVQMLTLLIAEKREMKERRKRAH